MLTRRQLSCRDRKPLHYRTQREPQSLARSFRPFNPASRRAPATPGSTPPQTPIVLLAPSCTRPGMSAAGRFERVSEASVVARMPQPPPAGSEDAGGGCFRFGWPVGLPAIIPRMTEGGSAIGREARVPSQELFDMTRAPTTHTRRALCFELPGPRQELPELPADDDAGDDARQDRHADHCRLHDSPWSERTMRRS